MSDHTKGVLIGGEWRTGSRGVFEVVNPATLEVIAQVADAGPDDAVAAVDAASQASGPGRHRAPGPR